MRSIRRMSRYQKIGIIKLNAVVAVVAILTALPSFAECRTAGFVYVWAGCPGRDWRKEGSPCHRKDDEPSFNAFIISNVIFDDISNDRFPGSHFYRMTANKFGDAMNGEVSACYASREEAEAAREEAIADRKTDSFSEYRIHHIELRDQ